MIKIKSKHLSGRKDPYEETTNHALRKRMPLTTKVAGILVLVAEEAKAIEVLLELALVGRVESTPREKKILLNTSLCIDMNHCIYPVFSK